MIIIALGSNLAGVWGTPKQALHRALDELANTGIQINETSRIYYSVPYGDAPQPTYLNASAIVSTPMPAHTLLRVFKEIEAQAGRLNTQKAQPLKYRWAPRPLDIDIVDYKGAICNWKVKRPLFGKRVVLPHPEAHKRAFVLRPICDIAPFWHHPVFGVTALALMKLPWVQRGGAILGDAGMLR
jgi:2-amino-4-hydroxy-6-hydroxymethyldihydropteridine diphosphokinase